MLSEIMSFQNKITNATTFLILLNFIHILLVTFIINFFSFWPFCKAYCIFKSDVYKKDLYRQIKSGDHQMSVYLRKLFNLGLVVAQLTILLTELAYLDVKFNMEETMGRMLTIQCADRNVNIANQ